MKGNDGLVFDPGNQFSDDIAPPYTVIPAWWRTFLFRMLKPRELSLYVYLCSLCDKHSIAYPSVAQIQHDLGIASATTVTAALKALEDLGLFLRKRGALPRRRSTGHQNIYQRPSAHHTILHLLKTRRVDGNLQLAPSSDETTPRESKAVHMALKKMLGPGYHRYEMLSNESERYDYLTSQLDDLLTRKRTTAAASFTLFQGGTAINAVSRLKRAEDQLIMTLHAVAYDRSGPSHNFDAVLALLPEVLRSQRDRLRGAVDRQSIPALESWFDGFTRDLSRTEAEIVALVSKANRSAISLAFDTYRLAPNRLAEALKPFATADVPF
jgi:hypothetical protein